MQQKFSLNKTRFLSLCSIFTLGMLLIKAGNAQEVIRYNTVEDDDEEEPYSIEEDSTFNPPRFPNGENAFFEYIETELGRPEWRYLYNPVGDIVVIRFEVGVEGHIIKPKVLRTTNMDLQAPMTRLLKNMPKWEPEIRNNQPVKSQVEYSLLVRSIDEFPYVEVTKEMTSGAPDPSTRYLKTFMVVGAVLILLGLLII